MLSKKIINRINKEIKEIESGKAKTFTMEEVMHHIKDRTEKEKHFPWCIYKHYRNIKADLKNSLYYIKCSLFLKYNVIKIKTLPPTWIDRDSILLHAMFKVFSDFIEREKPFDTISWDRQLEIEHAIGQEEKDRCIKEDIEVKNQKKELEDIYNWWKIIRPSKEKAIDDSWNKDVREKYEDSEGIRISQLEQELYEEEEEYMVRLIKIRKHLWT